MNDQQAHSQLTARPLIIWSIADGKPGHTTQAIGLTRAIEDRVPATTYTLMAPSAARTWSELLFRRCPFSRDVPDPDLIIGVGHRTHPAMLAARARRGGRAIVLMRPSLPLSVFDLAIIPQHDAPKREFNVITTRGVLNLIRPADNPRPDRGLILLGGPSRHVRWSDELIINQIQSILGASNEVHWHLTTSRRTLPTTADRVKRFGLPNLTVTPSSRTPPGWVAEQLAECQWAWVSADSVSMVYEALTAGARVGVLDVPYRRNSRAAAGLRDLVERGMVTTFERWQQTGELKPSTEPLCESDRCAELLIDHWLPQWGILESEKQGARQEGTQGYRDKGTKCEC